MARMVWGLLCYASKSGDAGDASPKQLLKVKRESPSKSFEEGNCPSGLLFDHFGTGPRATEGKEAACLRHQDAVRLIGPHRTRLPKCHLVVASSG